jgi:hypothetical protein
MPLDIIVHLGPGRLLLIHVVKAFGVRETHTQTLHSKHECLAIGYNSVLTIDLIARCLAHPLGGFERLLQFRLRDKRAAMAGKASFPRMTGASSLRAPRWAS